MCSHIFARAMKTRVRLLKNSTPDLLQSDYLFALNFVFSLSFFPIIVYRLCRLILHYSVYNFFSHKNMLWAKTLWKTVLSTKRTWRFLFSEFYLVKIVLKNKNHLKLAVTVRLLKLKNVYLNIFIHPYNLIPISHYITVLSSQQGQLCGSVFRKGPY